MLELICKRLLLAIPTLLLVSMMVFGLQKLLPGDPLTAMLGEERNPAVIAQLRAELNPGCADPGAVFQLVDPRATRRSWRFVTHAGTGDAPDCHQVASDAGNVAAGDDHRAGVRYQHGHPGGRQPS